MTSVKLAFVLSLCSTVNRVPEAIKWIVTETRETSEKKRSFDQPGSIRYKKCFATSSHVLQI